MLLSRLILEFTDLYPVNVNDAYIPTSGKVKDGNSRRSAFLRKSNELIEFQKIYSNRLDQYKLSIDNFIQNCKRLFDHLGFDVTILVGMPRYSFFYKRKAISDDLRPHDASNYIKTVEDGVSRCIGIDDKYNMEVHVVKYCNYESDNWEFYVIIDAVDYMKYNQSYIKEVYLNGNIQ